MAEVVKGGVFDTEVVNNKGEGDVTREWWRNNMGVAVW